MICRTRTPIESHTTPIECLLYLLFVLYLPAPALRSGHYTLIFLCPMHVLDPTPPVAPSHLKSESMSTAMES